MKQNSTRVWKAAGCVVLLVAVAGSATAEAPGEVAQALALVRNVGKEFYQRSGTTVDLLSYDDLVDGDLQLRRYPGRGSHEITFSSEDMKKYERLHKYCSITERQRSWNPLGISGAVVCGFYERTGLVVGGVIPGTPADGVLQRDDLIIGANGRLFENRIDSRPDMGFALAESQSPEMGGILTLQVIRAGRPANVKVDLGDAESYGPTYPYDCAKSARIVEEAVECIVKAHPAGDGLSSRHHGGGFWTPLFLMASGSDVGLDLARRAIVSEQIVDAGSDLAGAETEKPVTAIQGISAWSGSYKLITLAEYYLLTGDGAVWRQLEDMATRIANGQRTTGGWSHGCGLGPPGTAKGGYGEINNVGLTCFMGLILAREAGVQIEDGVMARSILYFGKHCGGNLGYGVGVGGTFSGGRFDNGMNATAALSFTFLGEQEMGERWAHTLPYMYMAREYGHGARVFNMAWDPLGAALVSRKEFAHQMNNMLWFYELFRTPGGAFDATMDSVTYYPAGTTGVIGLAMTLPKRRLRITGAEKSVFGMRPPADLAEAAALYKNKRWSACKAALDKYLANASAPNRGYAEKLLAKYKEMARHSQALRKLVEQSIAEGDMNIALERVDSLASLMGGETSTVKALRAQISSAAPSKSRKESSSLADLVDAKSRLIPPDPKKAKGVWQKILAAPSGKEATASGDILLADLDEPGPRGDWFVPTYSAQGWQRVSGATKLPPGKQMWLRQVFTTSETIPFDVLGFRLKVGEVGEAYLNGYRIGSTRRGEIMLGSQMAGAFASAGAKNVLAVHLSPTPDKATGAMVATSLEVLVPRPPVAPKAKPKGKK